VGGSRGDHGRLSRVARRLTGSGPRAAAALLPAAPGVYRFRDERGRSLYVGRAFDLRRRVASYWTGAPEVRGLGRMVARIDRVEAVPCDSAHEAAWLERNLLERSQPWWNRTAGGPETPVGIAVDVGPRRPGLRLLHDHELAGPAPAGTIRFGPFLGGNQVRSAMAGLLRAAPLHLVGEGLGGSERAMAVALGVAAADREPLLATVLGALARDPGAVAVVTGELDRRRDAAAARLDFETAAAIRDELAGVRWVTAPQRVTGADPSDAALAGWSDGWLVQLGVHGGRVETWTVRPATGTAAARHLAATPDPWRLFLDRAAALAARLAPAQA
jgi:excinuclease ABC subunit C